MKISVIIPVYNVEKYLPKCIESLINQDFDSYEILLIDDGSTDNSLNICKEYEKKSKKVKVFSQKNKGVSVARNLGLENAKGEWICFVDSDDFAENDMLSSFYDEAMKGDCDVLITPPIMDFDDYTNDAAIFEDNIDFTNKKDILIKNMICRQYNSKLKTEIGAGGPWGKLYKKSFLDETSVKFIEGLKRMQDVIFNIYVANKANKIIYKNIYKYHYRINQGSSTVKYNPTIYETFEKVITIMNEFVEKNKLDSSYTDAINMKTILLFIEGARIATMNKNYNISSIKRIKELKKVYLNKTFKNGFKNAKNKDLGTKLMIFKISTNLHLFALSYMMIKIFINSKHKEQN